MTSKAHASGSRRDPFGDVAFGWSVALGRAHVISSIGSLVCFDREAIVREIQGHVSRVIYVVSKVIWDTLQGHASHI